MLKTCKFVFVKSIEGKFTKYYNILPRKFASDVKSDILEIKVNERKYKYPIVWLRDNCQCERCFHQDSRSRIIDWTKFDVNVHPEYIDDNENNGNLFIKWSDGHSSTFKKDWLTQRNFEKGNQEKYLKNIYRKERYTWNQNNFNSILKKYDYQSILTNDEQLKNWLETLSRFGIAIIDNVPEDEESGARIANRVEFVKETHYGKKFAVRAKPGTTNVAYLSKNLQMHTDLPYYEYKPGVNLLHCVTQAKGKGGENLLSDGLFVANLLKYNHPKIYEILSNTLVDWEDIGKEGDNKFHSMYRSPVICEDLDGNISRINHSIPQRGSYFNIPAEKVKPWYDAMKIFVNLIHENVVTYKMCPGEILCFDNIRLLHGRNEYQDVDDHIRNVIGVYLDWDYIFSRIRVLEN